MNQNDPIFGTPSGSRSFKTWSQLTRRCRDALSWPSCSDVAALSCPQGARQKPRPSIALRGANITLQRQVRVRIFDGRRRLRYTYWLDFGDIGRRVALEIDGRLGHGTADRIQRDYRRDNILNSVFVIVRFSATDVNNDVGTLVRDMQRRLSETSPTLGPFRTERGLQVTPTNLGVDVVDRMF